MKVKPAELALINGPSKVVIRPRQASGEDPIMCKSWDLGAPDVRYTTTPNAGADGVTMSNGYLGQRTVILDLQILGDTVHDAYWYVSELTRMAHPNATPELTVVRYDTGDATPIDDIRKPRMMLRPNPYTLVYTARSAAIIDLQLSFTCPSGMIDSGLKSYTIEDVAGDDDAATDWIFPAIFPKGFGLVGATYPGETINVGGDGAVAPTIYITGPVTDPEIISDGDVFKFDGLTLDGGHTVGIDMGSGAVWLSDGSGSQVIDDMSAYGAVDWGVSTYWIWQPGIHHVQFMSIKGTVTVQFREQWFTI